jgi:hypothetical protein
MAYLPIGSSEASRGVVQISNANLDAFERVRVGLPTTVFDSNCDAQPLFWDDAVLMVLAHLVHTTLIRRL